MTVLELVQALVRRKRFVAIYSVVLALVTFFAVFKFDDGLAWRSGQKFQATAQIAVVTRGIESLSDAEARDERIGAAHLFAQLLQSYEALDWIAKRVGFEPEDEINALVPSGTSLINGSIVAPTEEQASAAARAMFDYLSMKLEEPFLLGGPAGSDQEGAIELSGPFSSRMILNLGQGLADVPGGLFLRINTTGNQEIVLELSESAGQTFDVEAVLNPVMSVLITLEDRSGNELDQVRLAAPAVAGYVTNLPILTVGIERSALSRTAEDWSLAESGISLGWEAGSPVVSPSAPVAVPVRIALINENPVPEPIGGRAGPILLAAFLVLGAIILLTIVVIAEMWSREGPAGTSRPDEPTVLHPFADERPEEEEGGALRRLARWEVKGIAPEDH